MLFSFNFAVTAPSDMRPSPPCLRLLSSPLSWFLGMMFLAGLPGCGPAVSDQASDQKFRASLGAPSMSQPVSQQTPSPRNNPFTPAASPVPFASNNAPAPAAQEEAVPEDLVLPTWIAQALDAPEVSVRLQALDMWAQQGAQAPLDPLVVALDDEDDDVRTKAMEIIEQHWAIEQEAEPEAMK